MQQPERQQARRRILEASGASQTVVDELLAYNDSPFDPSRLALVALPLDDEPHLDTWTAYAEDAARIGAFSVLEPRLPQFRFPVERGISETAAYRAATLRGEDVATEGGGLALQEPDRLELVIHASLAGRVPILTAPNRDDFAALVRALSARNEPIPVPASMGACFVTGFNNWDRIRRYRRRLEAAHGAMDQAAWAREFAEIVNRRDLYQDRFIILSRGPYSGVAAQEVGIDGEEWLARSLIIRREHECTHYLGCRVLGSVRKTLHDELIADFAGLLAAFNRYDGRLALRCLGLDVAPRDREGGRFRLYLGPKPLSAPAIDVLHSLVVGAVARLEAVAAAGSHPSPRLLLALLGLTLEELSSADGPLLRENVLVS